MASDLKKGQKCVVVLPDGVRNYMTKFLDNNWLVDRDILQEEAGEALNWWEKERVSSLDLSAPLSILPTVSVEHAIEIMSKEGYDQLPVITQTGAIAGVTTLGSLKAKLLKGMIMSEDPISKATYSTFKKVTLETTLGSTGSSTRNTSPSSSTARDYLPTQWTLRPGRSLLVSPPTSTSSTTSADGRPRARARRIQKSRLGEFQNQAPRHACMFTWNQNQAGENSFSNKKSILSFLKVTCTVYFVLCRHSRFFLKKLYRQIFRFVTKLSFETNLIIILYF